MTWTPFPFDPPPMNQAMNESKTPRIRATNLGLSTALEVCQTCGAAQCPSQIESGECFYCIARKLKAELAASRAREVQLRDTVIISLDTLTDGETSEPCPYIPAIESCRKALTLPPAPVVPLAEHEQALAMIGVYKDRVPRELAEKLADALDDIANMPEHDQDDAHRLRHKAKFALTEWRAAK